MPADVVHLDDHRPHMTGPAQCVACGHTWQAVAPVGTVELECPECGTMKGLFRLFTEPYEATAGYVCQCGSYAFRIDLIGGKPRVSCLVCGSVADPWRQ